MNAAVAASSPMVDDALGTPSPTDDAPGTPSTIDDALGTPHRRWPDRATLRIVSLVPSLTELLCDLGLASAVVGRTGWCIHPAGVVDGIAKIGGTKTVNVEKIRRLAPTHLVVNVDENPKPVVDALAAFVPHVVVTHPTTPDDNVGLYRLFGHVFGCDAEAADLVARFERARRGLDARHEAGRDAGGRSVHAGHASQRVLYLIWKDPWMTIARDTYIAAMLASIGWRQVDVGDAFDVTTPSSPRYPAIDLARAVAGVDRILLSSEPYRFTDEHVASLASLAPRVQLVDGEMLSWYGSRAIAGLAYLARLRET